MSAAEAPEKTAAEETKVGCLQGGLGRATPAHAAGKKPPRLGRAPRLPAGLQLLIMPICASWQRRPPAGCWRGARMERSAPRCVAHSARSAPRAP